jgi:hypothetical protein
LALGALGGKNKRDSIFWFLFAATGLVLGLGHFTPLYHWIFLYLPGFSMIRVAYRYIFLFVLALGVLAAWGWDSFFDGKPFHSRNRIGKYLPWIYGLLFILLAFLRPSFNWREILGLGLGLLVLALWVTNIGGIRIKQFLALSALGIPLFLNAWGNYQPGPSSNFDFEKNSAGLGSWGRALAPRRIFFDSPHIYYPIQVGGTKYILSYPQNAAAPLGIKDIGGYNPLVLQAKTDLGTLPFPLVAKLGAIGGWVTGLGQETVPGFNLKKEPPYSLLTSTRMPPYVFAPGDVVSVMDSKSSLALLREPGFDPYQKAVLLSPPPLSFTKGNIPPSLSYQILQDEPGRQTFDVTVSRPCVTVFCETVYPGWKAWVDGKPAPILTADHLLRALALESGPHRVEFRFEPFWWPWVLWGLAGWFLLTLGFRAFFRRVS